MQNTLHSVLVLPTSSAGFESVQSTHALRGDTTLGVSPPGKEQPVTWHLLGTRDTTL